MSGAKLEIQWSPISSQFITWGSEICLYQIEPLKDVALPSVKLSDAFGAHLLACNSNHHYVKCVDICPQVDSELLLAIGQANGNVVLTTFGPSQFDSFWLTGKDQVPQRARQCNAVAWNPLEPNILAAGLDKSRTDNSVLLWDVAKNLINGKAPDSGRLMGTANSTFQNVTNAVELPKPFLEFGITETAHSLAWFNTQPKMMAVGINSKNIKIIDLRDSAKYVNTTATKADLGLCLDPHNDRHLASFAENQVYVWDTRNFEKPVLTLSHSKAVLKVRWSPTRNNLLATLQKDSSFIQMYDIQHTMVGNEEVEPSVLERTVDPGSPHNITSFSWHGTDENRLLTIALSGNISDYTVLDRITLNWAPSFNMAWTLNRRTMKTVNTLDNNIPDISSKIKQRTLSGYGLKTDLWANGELCDDPKLASVWSWLHLSKSLVEEGDIKGTGSKHPGVRTVLKLDNVLTNNVSIKTEIPWTDLGNKNCISSAKVYKSEDRDKALHLCGWMFDKDPNALHACIETLTRQQNYSKAAAIAVFNLKLHLAIDLLNQGADRSKDNSHTMMAMALAGFSDDKNSMWRQLCSATRSTLADPYLRAMFAFLTSENSSYEHVLNENGVSVQDRVAFACNFLSDTKLADYLRIFTVKLTEEGNLDGILLTGNSMEGVELLQKYLNITGDIQSTTLIAVRSFPTDILMEPNVQEWILSYRSMLDSWKLWDQRAQFDIMLSSCSSSGKPPQQVYISCNFCGKSISALMQKLHLGRGPFTGFGDSMNKLKMSSCPNCRKPLPRCAICLMHMGTSYHSQGYLSSQENGDYGKLIDFNSWFTWCQTCRHGGHSEHMINWFKEHTECPVTPCTCRCFSVDAFNSSLFN